MAKVEQKTIVNCYQLKNIRITLSEGKKIKKEIKKMSKKSIAGLTFLTFVIMVGLSFGYADIHPQEHPEHPTTVKSDIDRDSLAKAIKDYVKQDTELRGGYFMVYDQKAQKTLALKLVLVHKAKLSKVAKDVYFACADFKASDGKMYDLDIFMKGNGMDNMKVTEISIHKEDGKPRYTWQEKSGIWTKNPVKD